MIKVCRVCGREFEGRANRILCSNQCTGRSLAAPPRPCANCGRLFRGRARLRFCGHPCWDEWRRRSPRRLTPRQASVIAGLAQGYTVEEIAAQFVIEIESVKVHQFNAYKRLGAHTLADALRAYRELVEGPGRSQ